jgi:hypothetical protein
MGENKITELSPFDFVLSLLFIVIYLLCYLCTVFVGIDWMIDWCLTCICKFITNTIFLYSRELNLKFKFNSRDRRNIVTHMGNWRRISFSRYLTRTLFQNPLADLYTKKCFILYFIDKSDRIISLWFCIVFVIYCDLSSLLFVYCICRDWLNDWLVLIMFLL